MTSCIDLTRSVVTSAAIVQARITCSVYARGYEKVDLDLGRTIGGDRDLHQSLARDLGRPFSGTRAVSRASRTSL